MIEKHTETKIVETQTMLCDKCGEEIVRDPEDDDPPYHCIICDGDFCNNDICNKGFAGLGYYDDICASCKTVIKFDEVKKALQVEYDRKNQLRMQKVSAIKVIDDHYNELFTDSDNIRKNIKEAYIRNAREELHKYWGDG